MKKRIVPIFLFIMLSTFIIATICYASEGKNNIFDEQKLLKKKIMPSEIDPSHNKTSLTPDQIESIEIEEFGKTLNEIAKEQKEKIENAIKNAQNNEDFQAKWSSDYSDYSFAASTHRWLTMQGKNMLYDDGKSNWYKLANKYRNQLYNGSDDADFDGIFDLWACHFHEPDEDKTFIPGNPTAADECQQFFDEAVVDWKKGNKEDAMYWLGKSVHFLQDCNMPHHAALYLAPKTSHDEFEDYANEVKYDYGYDSDGYYNYASTPWKYCDRVAGWAKGYIDSVDDVNDTSDWDWVTDTNLRRAQKTTAGLLGEFFEAVGESAN